MENFQTGFWLDSDPELRRSALAASSRRIPPICLAILGVDAEPAALGFASADLRELNRTRGKLNRELSWIQFNRRVLAEARNTRHPLLERLRFVAISEANLNEFLVVRLAGVQARVRAGQDDAGADGRTPSDELHDVRAAVRAFMLEQRQTLAGMLPELVANRVEIVGWQAMPMGEQERLRTWIRDLLMPACRVVTLNPHPRYPFISGQGLNLLVSLRYSRNRRRIAVINVPPEVPGLLAVAVESGKSGRAQFIWLEDAFAAAMPDVFPDASVDTTSTFRLLRNADFEVHNINAQNLVDKVRLGIQRREHGEAVALQIEANLDESLERLLAQNVGLQTEDVYAVERPLGLSGLSVIAHDQRPRLQYMAPSGRASRALRTPRDVFAAVRQRDRLLYHPFDSFEPVLRLLQQAATDPLVQSIKLALYRIDTPVVDALCEAARAGRSVSVQLELKARFDEKNNLAWARRLEDAGVDVHFGFAGLKIHCKTLLIQRIEGDGMRHYVHLGTGNYNSTTAKQYTDLSLLTCDPELATDIEHVFAFLFEEAPLGADFRKALVSPVALRAALEQRIEREIDAQLSTGRGHIVLKMNALTDPAMIDLLCRASRAGVEIDLIVRGACCLRPEVSGFSSGIRVISPIGRFLEHSRIFYFGNGGQEEILIGSADIMQRNLDYRVEVVAPVRDRAIQRRLKDLLRAYLSDRKQSYELQADGTYVAFDGRRWSRPVQDRLLRPGPWPFSAWGRPSLSGRRSGA